MKQINKHWHGQKCVNQSRIPKFLRFAGISVSIQAVAILPLSALIMLSGCDKSASDILEKSKLDETVIGQMEVNPDELNTPSDLTEDVGKVTIPLSCRNKVIIDAYHNQTSSVQVKGCGEVKVVLPDDNKGSRHQRFIVELDAVEPSHTVLIAHNIDLAPKITELAKGDSVLFYGEYEYNPQGGVVHWTHHDPAARHQGGWIEHKGERFE